jgi:hypothetical protein
MNTQGTQVAPNRGMPNRATGADAQQQHDDARLSAEKNGMAIAALVLGVTGLATSIVSVGGLFGILGLVVSVPALWTAKRTGTGRSQAIAGAVTASVAIVVAIAVVILAVWFGHKTQSCYHLNQIQQWTRCVDQQFDRR